MDEKFESFFQRIDDATISVQKKKNMTYLEALTNVGEVLFRQEEASDHNEYIQKLKNEISIADLTKEQIRKALQLLILKGMKQATQANHAMTPDTVAMFISYLVNKFTKDHKQISILDPAIGTGNLLTAVLNQIERVRQSYGFEPDETLLKLAYVSANLQQHNVELFHQDSLTNMYIDPVDVVIADLPVGYYPNEEVAKQYQLKAANGLSYVHHLMIEQTMKYVKNGGFLFFIIPNFMLETPEAATLHKFLKEQAWIYALLQLPKSMFNNEKYEKSILVLRKHGDDIQPPSQALLVELPSFSNKTALGDIIKSMEKWFDDHL